MMLACIGNGFMLTFGRVNFVFSAAGQQAPSA
jgi:hypothetical protein